MKQLAAAALLFLTTLSASAQVQSPLARDAKTELVASDLHALGRVVAVAENIERERQVLLAIVDSDIKDRRATR